MARQVRIVGHDDVWEVLCETETSMVLVNPAARERRQIAELAKRLAEAQRALAAHQPVSSDVNGTPITGP